MKKIALLCFALAGGLQAMEVGTDLEKRAEELVQLQEEGEELYIVVEDNTEATYLFLVARHGAKAHEHISREFKGSSEVHLEKAKGQLALLGQILQGSEEYHWNSFFSARRDELDPGSLIYKINTQITREALDKVLQDSVLTQGMRTLNLSSQEDLLNLAAKAARTRIRKSWEKGYVLSTKLCCAISVLSVFSSSLITYAITASQCDCE